MTAAPCACCAKALAVVARLCHGCIDADMTLCSACNAWKPGGDFRAKGDHVATYTDYEGRDYCLACAAPYLAEAEREKGGRDFLLVVLRTLTHDTEAMLRAVEKPWKYVTEYATARLAATTDDAAKVRAFNERNAALAAGRTL